jgi:hypothetical protein
LGERDIQFVLGIWLSYEMRNDWQRRWHGADRRTNSDLFWRTLVFLTGLLLYRGAIRVVASNIHFLVSATDPGWRPTGL